MVKGVSSKKGTAKYLYFQPLYIFDIEIYHKSSGDLQTLKEICLSYTPLNIPVDVYRSTLALFLSEVLYAVIREEDVNIQLFNFIESSVIALDSITGGVSNFHLWFLCALSAYVGIGPTVTNEKSFYFDMINGQFVATPPIHPDYLEPNSADIFNRLMRAEIEDIATINLSGEMRTMLLDQVIKYYNLHLPGMRRIRSLRVLNEVFR